MLTLKQKLDMAKQEEAIRFAKPEPVKVKKPRKPKAEKKEEATEKKKTVKKTKTKKNG